MGLHVTVIWIFFLSFILLMSGGDSAEKVDDKRDEVEKLFSSRGVSSHDEGLKGDVDV